MSAAEAWRSRLRTLLAMALLCLARLLIAIVPLRWWRRTLGQVSRDMSPPTAGPALRDAVRLASHVERAAERLPFETRCLPRAMALAWLLRRAGLGYCLVIAIRPQGRREEADGLHAWVDYDGVTVLGELPGPWQPVLALRWPPIR